jgi:NTP pyrophosphatase (non-canonical NTP hydrolase)
MDLKTYAEKASKTNAVLGDKLTNNLHMILGLVTEVGELSDVFKKWLAYKREIDWINVQEEIGDLMWYIINFCTINGFDLEKILEQNIAKLEARYPDKFTEERATNRDLTKERKILEELGYKIE